MYKRISVCAVICWPIFFSPLLFCCNPLKFAMGLLLEPDAVEDAHMHDTESDQQSIGDVCSSWPVALSLNSKSYTKIWWEGTKPGFPPLFRPDENSLLPICGPSLWLMPKGQLKARATIKPLTSVHTFTLRAGNWTGVDWTGPKSKLHFATKLKGPGEVQAPPHSATVTLFCVPDKCFWQSQAGLLPSSATGNLTDPTKFLEVTSATTATTAQRSSLCNWM